MIIKGILPFSKQLIDTHVTQNDIVVDATCGNGYDTNYLAQRAKHVFSFDIQLEAIEQAKKTNDSYKNITFIHDGHEHVRDYVSEPISCAIFNLGYLPKGDKSIVTHPETTIIAIQELMTLLSPKGIIILVVYPGHDEGQVEKEAVLKYVEQIPQDIAHVLKYEFINQKNRPPLVIAIEKRK